ncbi:hypothetical protein [Myxococcus sp. Y35]|uniref:hypothetical protein n=1 Tax=Pseudomyxococcus flavus TaxID=3115648 RepID=UPI003CEBC9A8
MTRVRPLSLLALGAMALGCAITPAPLPRAPAEEASRFTFPTELPAEGLLHLDGNTAAAIQLALEDFRPRGLPIPADTRPDETCLYEQRSYDVTFAPGPEGVVLVQFTQNDAVCPPSPELSVEARSGKPLLDVTTYAVDIRTMRILSVGVHVRPRS